jgi:chromosome segregation ATPase
MDPKNERKIFQMLVDITCQPGQSQYFFVTPKLLPDLPSHELMTVAIVYNGKYVSDPFVFLSQEDEPMYEGSDEEED